MPPQIQSIEAWRKERGLTQEQLSERLSVTVVTISRWENGHFEPHPQTLLALKALEHEFPIQTASSGESSR